MGAPFWFTLQVVVLWRNQVKLLDFIIYEIGKSLTQEPTTRKMDLFALCIFRNHLKMMTVYQASVWAVMSCRSVCPPAASLGNFLEVVHCESVLRYQNAKAVGHMFVPVLADRLLVHSLRLNTGHLPTGWPLPWLFLKRMVPQDLRKIWQGMLLQYTTLYEEFDILFDHMQLMHCYDDKFSILCLQNV